MQQALAGVAALLCGLCAARTTSAQDMLALSLAARRDLMSIAACADYYSDQGDGGRLQDFASIHRQMDADADHQQLLSVRPSADRRAMELGNWPRSRLRPLTGMEVAVILEQLLRRLPDQFERACEDIRARVARGLTPFEPLAERFPAEVAALRALR
ncbi:hypothetical protein [Muricoccus radiodurans]|uniref:hypothetical protein n=1 Tax=Muricoccus radiodurans TaxID=2231721 RepID=UPI003CF1B435